MNAYTTDMELQREVMEMFGERYPDMTLIDWHRIINAYTPLVREASRPKVISLQQYDRAAEEHQE